MATGDRSRPECATLKTVLLLVLLLTGCASHAAEEKNPDPWMRLNRVTQSFNDTADRYVLKPVARGYKKVLPSFVRKGIRNFFSNLGDVNNAANNFLQGKGGAGIEDLSRIVINTTIGIGGIFDPASAIGLQKHSEDFGQTFSVWGIPAGPYLVLPLLGPSTLTDAVGRPFDKSLDPLRQVHPTRHRNLAFAVDIVRAREELLGVEQVVFGDKYIFYRDAYLQRREFKVKDGKVEYSFDDDF